MPDTFASLGVAPELVAVLAERGITEPFAIQALTLSDALAGRDVCGKAKTGSGKTLAFGVPLIQRMTEAAPAAPRGLVLVPTRELAVQVARELEALGDAMDVVVEAVYGGTDLKRQSRSLAEGIDLVVATPGRLIDLVDTGACRLDEIEAVVLDEADRMADMGFLPQVEWLLRRVTGPHQTLLFSATLDGEVDGVIRRHQKDPVRHEVASTTVTVDEMAHRFLFVHQLDKVRVAAAIGRGVDRCLVFVRTKRGADRLAGDLVREGVRAAAIHGDLRQRDRERALEDFTAGTLPVLVATDVAARGIHVEDIDVVLHYDPPSDHKAYLHRSGRTARAGTAGVVATLVLWDQENEVRMLQKRVGLDIPLVEVFSNDARLSDLDALRPEAGAVA